MMKENELKTLYTIGHSTHEMNEFLEMLRANNITVLADIRSLPGSRKYPQYDKENLERVLPENGIEYIYLKDLGGLRKAKKDSENTVWRNASFRGYADYMETPEFEAAVNKLKEIARSNRTAVMCAEAVWWRCHRSMVADYLKAEGWLVLHIMSKEKTEEHPYTQPAKIVNGKLVYGAE